MKTLKMTLTALACALILSAPVDADTPREIDVPAGKLVAALESLAKQAEVNLVYQAAEIQGFMTAGVSGTFTPREAVAKLLSGTSLRLNVDQATGAMMISSANTPTKTSARISQYADVRLAQSSGNSDTENPGSKSLQDSESSSEGSAMESAKLEEVIVTAQKREERLQDVPILMSVLSGENLNKSTYLGVTEALRTVPGVVVNISGQGGESQLSVRGVSSASPTLNGASPVAYYMDSAPFGLVKSSIVPDPNVYDLDRIEVLRGPQGTLYGANALNGVVRVLTKDPQLDGFELQSRASISTTKAGGESERVDGAVNLPLIPGKLAVRVVAGYLDQTGWIDRTYREDANDAKTRTGRFKIKAQPTDRLSVIASAWISRTDRGAPSTSMNNRTSAIVIEEEQSSDFDLYGLNATYDFSNFSLNSATSYLEYVNPGVQALSQPLRTTFDADMFAQEVNVVSNLQGPWRWSFGGMYRDAKDLLIQYFGTFTPVVPIDYVQSSESVAVFGEVARQFFDGRWELAAGLRYFRDEVGQRERQDFERNTTPNGIYDNTFTFEKVTPRAVLMWRPNDSLTTYASYSEGFRSGADQTPIVRNQAPFLDPTKPDSLKNYEVGLKSNLWDGRLGFETAVFYIDWQDVQQSLRVPYQTSFVTAIVNGKSASGMGFEVVVTAKPFEGFALGASVGWNDLHLDSDVFSNGTVLFPKGARLGSSPEYTGGAWTSYECPLGSGGYIGRLSASANYTTEAISRTLTQTLKSDDLLFGNASFSVEAPAGWAATLFVDNFTNEEGVYSPGTPTDGSYHTRPRTVGLQFEYRFQ